MTKKIVTGNNTTTVQRCKALPDLISAAKIRKQQTDLILQRQLQKRKEAAEEGDAAVLAAWKAFRDFKVNSVTSDQMRCYFNRIGKYIESWAAASENSELPLTFETLPSYCHALFQHLAQENYSPQYFNHHLISWRTFEKYLLGEGYVEKIDLIGLHKRKKLILNPKVPVDNDVSRLISILHDYSEGYAIKNAGKRDWDLERNLVLISLLIHTGIRTAEALRLKPSDFDFHPEQGAPFVRVHENASHKSKPRDLALSSPGLINRLRDLIKRHQLLLPNSSFVTPLFCKMKRGERKADKTYFYHGEQMKTADLTDLLRKISQTFGLKNVSPKCFRAYFATKCGEKNCNAHTLQALLGHSTIGMAEHYIAKSQERLRADCEKFAPKIHFDAVERQQESVAQVEAPVKRKRGRPSKAYQLSALLASAAAERMAEKELNR